MMSRNAPFVRRGVVVAAVISSLCAVVAGCSESEQSREYVTPTSLCGVSVDSGEIAPFLPGGRSISVQEENSSTRKECKVIVDNKVAATAVREWLESGKATSDFVTLQTLEAVDKTADGGRYAYSGTEAFGKTRTCRDARNKQELYTSIQFWGTKHEDAESMKRLISDFTDQVEKKPECTAGVSG